MKNWTWNFQKTTSTDLELCSNRRLFISFQIKCIRRGRATRLIFWCNPLLLLKRHRSTLDREDIEQFRWSHYLTGLHNNEVQSQLKNRWAWDSSSRLHRTQIESIKRKLSWSFILILSRTTSHRIKLYHGKDHCSHTKWCQLTGFPLTWKNSWALAMKDPGPRCQPWRVSIASEIPPN